MSASRFWSGNKVARKAFPEVKGKVMGYLTYQKAYKLLLADAQVHQALQARLYSPAGMPGQARIEVAAAEIVLCDTEKKWLTDVVTTCCLQSASQGCLIVPG